MNVRIAADIDELDAELWSCLAMDCVGARYDLVRALDADSDSGLWQRYCVITDGDAYRCAARLTSQRMYYDPPLGSVLYGRGARIAAFLGLRADDAVFCEWPVGRGGGVLVDSRSSSADRVELVHRMCAVIEEAAGDRAVIFPDVLPGDAPLGEILARRGYLMASSLPVAFLDIRWRTLDEYIATLEPKRRRHSVRSEIRRYCDAGAVTHRASSDVLDWADICELLDRHHARLNGQPLGHRPSTLRRLACALGDDFVVYTSHQNGDILGVHLVVRHGCDATALWIGIDHDGGAADFTYFNLLFYAPAEELAGLGVRRHCLGNGVYHAKLLRGCRVVPSNAHLKLTSRPSRIVHRPALAVQRGWYRRKFERFLEAGAQ